MDHFATQVSCVPGLENNRDTIHCPDSLYSICLMTLVVDEALLCAAMMVLLLAHILTVSFRVVFVIFHRNVSLSILRQATIGELALPYLM